MGWAPEKEHPLGQRYYRPRDTTADRRRRPGCRGHAAQQNREGQKKGNPAGVGRPTRAATVQRWRQGAAGQQGGICMQLFASFRLQNDAFVAQLVERSLEDKVHERPYATFGHGRMGLCSSTGRIHLS